MYVGCWPMFVHPYLSFSEKVLITDYLNFKKVSGSTDGLGFRV